MLCNTAEMYTMHVQNVYNVCTECIMNKASAAYMLCNTAEMYTMYVQNVSLTMNCVS